MRTRLIIPLGVLLVCAVLIVSAQDQDQEVRGAFISTRPKTTANTNAPARRHRPPRTNTSATTKNTNSGQSHVVNANVKVSANGNASVSVNAAAIGLGYTLFMKDVDGRSIRVAPDHEFHNGDSVRISLEPNIDGYLYVFHTEGDGPPEMLYPDSRLDGAENWIEAHVPMEVPSSEETDERFRWFRFYGNPGTERLYIVVTRAPLPMVPTGDALVSFCTANKQQCPWHPPEDIWKQVQDVSKAGVRVVTSKTFGQAETEKEKNATTRGLGLDQTAPEPAVIRMNASTNAPILVTVLDLAHK